MILILFNVWLIWTMIFIPIRKKDKIEKKRDEAFHELREIQAEKAIEWDKYKDLTDNLTKLRDQFIALQRKFNTKQEEVAKLETSVENLKAANKEKTTLLKKQEKKEKTD